MLPVALVFVISFFSFLVFPSHVFANTVRIEPAYVDVTLSENEDEKEISFFITNRTDKEISLELSSLDFKQEDQSGVISFLGKETTSYSYSLSSFLAFGNSHLELSPGEKRKIFVTVNNREDLSPGGHYAALIVRQTTLKDDKQAIISPAVSSLIYLIKKGGERYNLSLKDVSFPSIPVVFSYPATYLLLLQNDGNIHLFPYGRADITDVFGRLIYKGIINEQSIRVMPQSRRNVPVYSKNVAFSLPISINKLSIEGRDSQNKVKFAYSDYFLYVNPWIFPVFLAIGFLGAKRLRRDKK